MAKKLVSSLVAQIQQLEKNAHLVDLAMKALPLEKRVQLFKEWIPTSTVPYKSLLRIMHLTKKDVSSKCIPTHIAQVIHVKGAGYVASGDTEVFTHSIEKAERFTMPEAVAAVRDELKADGWKRKDVEVVNVICEVKP